MKYCKDCKHSGKYTELFCNHPRNGISNVTGKPNTRFSAINRTAEQVLYEISCGEIAEWFEPKEVVKDEIRWYSKFLVWREKQ